MEGQREVEWDMQAIPVGAHLGTASQMVYPFATAAVVIYIVVLVVGGTVYRVGHTGPLEPVACTLCPAGVAADLLLWAGASTDVPHATANLHSIGGDDVSCMGGAVGKSYAVCWVVFLKGETAQIDPCGPAHLLVHMERCVSTQVADRIAGLAGAFGKGLIGDIHSVPPGVGHRGSPGDDALLAFTDGTGLSACAVLERILPVVKGGRRVGKSFTLSGCPCLIALYLRVSGFWPGAAIVVHNHLVVVHVALSGQHHVAACPFQHGYQIGEHVALCEQVLHRLEDAGTLPLPPVEALLVIVAVALPQCDVAAPESLGGHMRLLEGGHQRDGAFGCKAGDSPVLLLACSQRDEFLN